jgi:hypothetical protein
MAQFSPSLYGIPVGYNFYLKAKQYADTVFPDWWQRNMASGIFVAEISQLGLANFESLQMLRDELLFMMEHDKMNAYNDAYEYRLVNAKFLYCTAIYLLIRYDVLQPLSVNIFDDGYLRETFQNQALVTTVKKPLELTNDGLRLRDTNGSHLLTIKPGSDLTANRNLTITTGDADRTITLSGNPTLNDWFDQEVKTSSTPAFAGVSLNGTIDGTIQQDHETDAEINHVITEPLDSPASADALRDDLVTNTLSDIVEALNALGTKYNNLLAKLEATGILKDE